jgi:hypothetical protein
VPEHQKYVSGEGLTIPEGAEGIPNANLGTDSLPGKTVRLSLSGKAFAALLEFAGSAQYTLDGKLARGTERMKPTQITTTKKDGVWLKVTGLGIDKDGFLLVSDESGSTYRIALGSGFRGSIEEK